MSIPRIRKEFKRIDRETAKAILFVDFDGATHWIPKSLCTLVKKKNDKVVATLSARKFEEITGIEVEDMQTAFVPMGGEPLADHRIAEPLRLVESEQKPLFDVQRETLLQRHLQCRYHALFWEAGTGKTLCSLTLANSYYHAGCIDTVVVLCPAHLQEQWKSFAKENFPRLPLAVFSTQSSSFKTSLSRLVERYGAIDGRKHLIIDESQLIKNQSARRTKNTFKHLRSDFTTICTATPIGKSAGDLYYQFGMLDTAIIGSENYGSYEKHFLLLGGVDASRIVALQNTAALGKRISPYLSFLTKKDIKPTHPPKRYITREFDMNSSQREALRYLNQLVLEIQSKSKHNFLPDKKAYQINSFLQKIASGFVPNEEEMRSIFAQLGTLGEMADNVSRIKHIAYTPNNNRIRLLREVLDSYDEQAVIWCKYIEEIEELSSELPDSRQMTGADSLKSRWRLCEDFRNKRFKYLIATLQLGNGLDFPTINLSINFTTTWDFIQRKQLEDRTDRIISTHPTTVIDLVARNSIDTRIQQVLQYKEKVADIFNGERL